MRAPAALLILSLAAACGGRAASSGAPRGAAAVPRQPVRVEVAAAREGGALRVDVTGVARGHGEGEALEDPAAWVVEAVAAGAPLRRLVNAQAAVEREPVGEAMGDQWDVTVRFTVFFQLSADATAVEVRVTPPGEAAARAFSLALE